ncbi:MAG: hypothetical protein [Caudoviricetes sp.]|nr:MAG: hypothetical protein [Caudoviricetes sp.]
MTKLTDEERYKKLEQAFIDIFFDGVRIPDLPVRFGTIECPRDLPLSVGIETNDAVKNPKHYQIIDDFESIDVIACSLTEEQFKGFCLGNILKYRIRAGNKDSLEQDIAKSDEYKSIFENKKHLCRRNYSVK